MLEGGFDVTERKRERGLGTVVLIIGLSASGCLFLWAARNLIVGKLEYKFLLWNLMLAMVPFAIAAIGYFIVEKQNARGSSRLGLFIITLLWLGFYPNAPYIFTDFIHIVNRSYFSSLPPDLAHASNRLWLDILMNTTFAFIGHFVGLASMWLMHRLLARAVGPVFARVVIAVAILLAGFGIYLGRFSRLNTWDIFFDAPRVFAEIAQVAGDPAAMIFSLLFSIFVFLSYTALYFLLKLGGAVDSRATSS